VATHPAVVALTIAGSDSGGGAGIQADLKTFAAFGVYGVSAITAVTAQNTRGVSAVETLSPGIVSAQIAAIVDDFQVAALKTGMLANSAIIGAVARVLRVSRVGPLVVDPVMVAKSGDRLLDADALDALTRDLLPLAAVVTPNLPEAEVLTGMPVRTVDDQREAARRIVERGARAAVVKGRAFRLRRDRGRVLRWRGVHGVPRGAGAWHQHARHRLYLLGRDCRAARARPRRPRGDTAAQAYVARAIQNRSGVGHGHGPMGHL
jgi:hydroxymethylpyrimidine/phosphomethylpyrimidine kinase